MQNMKLQLLNLTMLLATPVLLAQSGGDFEIEKSTMEAGGETLSGGNYELHGTLGQADASLQTAKTDQYDLTGGFWANGAITLVKEIFKDSFED